MKHALYRLICGNSESEESVNRPKTIFWAIHRSVLSHGSSCMNVNISRLEIFSRPTTLMGLELRNFFWILGSWLSKFFSASDISNMLITWMHYRVKGTATNTGHFSSNLTSKSGTSNRVWWLIHPIVRIVFRFFPLFRSWKRGEFGWPTQYNLQWPSRSLKS